MEKVLKDPLQVKERVNGKYPFEFKAPTYDNRSSRGISAGDYYGVGRKTPVGKERPEGLGSGPIPMESSCFNESKIFTKVNMKG
jgi:hypothetical protein